MTITLLGYILSSCGLGRSCSFGIQSAIFKRFKYFQPSVMRVILLVYQISNNSFLKPTTKRPGFHYKPHYETSWIQLIPEWVRSDEEEAATALSCHRDDKEEDRPLLG